MEIPEEKPLSVIYTHHPFMDGTPTGPSSETGTKNKEEDVVALSEDAKKISVAGRTINQLPDIREDKVAAMKRRIESGTYRIMGDQIASNLIRETMENNDILNHIDTVA